MSCEASRPYLSLIMDEDAMTRQLIMNQAIDMEDWETAAHAAAKLEEKRHPTAIAKSAEAIRAFLDGSPTDMFLVSAAQMFARIAADVIESAGIRSSDPDVIRAVRTAGTNMIVEGDKLSGLNPSQTVY